MDELDSDLQGWTKRAGHELKQTRLTMLFSNHNRSLLATARNRSTIIISYCLMVPYHNNTEPTTCCSLAVVYSTHIHLHIAVLQCSLFSVPYCSQADSMKSRQVVIVDKTGTLSIAIH